MHSSERKYPPIEPGRIRRHPEDGPILILSGAETIGGRITNHFLWRVLATNEKKSGYGGGDNWEDITDQYDLVPIRKEAGGGITTISKEYAEQIANCLEELQSAKESVWWNQDGYGDEHRRDAEEVMELRRQFCDKFGLPFEAEWSLPEKRS